MSSTIVMDITELLNEVQTLLDKECEQRDFHLKVPENGYKIDEDWTIIAASPTRAGIRAYDYVEVLSKAEKELRTRGHKHVLLVPALQD
ncbi:MAG: hypothetical protein NTX50_27415 [Candidatus Sumerlaeota bacterium]|nr:hypothetical protein [Candidatus Sumerlaeota bacterium]